MPDALAQAFVDVLPNMDRFGPALADGITQGGSSSTASQAAQRAGESIATQIGNGLKGLGAQVGGPIGTMLSTVGRGFDALGQSGGNLGVKFLAVGGAALGLGTALQSMGSAESAAQQQLQAAITATGQSWGDYETRIQRAIKAGENFGQDAAATQNALQALTSATNDPAKALQFLAVAFNLAAARHIDLASAAALVARALDGNTRLLKQYGIDTTGVAKSTGAASDAVTKLGTKLSGQAAASVNTFNGHIEVLKTKLGDLAGQFAGPVGSGLQGFGAGTAIVGGLLESGMIRDMRDAIGAAEGFRGKLAALSGSGVGSLAKFGIAVAAVTAAANVLQNMFGTTDPGHGINQLISSLKQLPQQSSDFRQFAAAGTDFTTTIGRLTDPGVVDRANHVAEALNSLVGLGGGPQADAKQAVTQLDQALTQMVNNGQARVAATDLAQMDAALLAAGKNVDAFHKLLPGYTDALAGLTPAEQQAAAGGMSMAASAALAKANYDKLTTALDTFNQTNISAQQADIATRDAFAQLNAALKVSHGSLSLLTQKGRDARTQVLAVASAVDAQAASMAAEHKPHSAIVALYEQQRVKLEGVLTKMGLTKAAADKYSTSLLKIPKNITTQVTLDISAHLKDVYAAGIHAGAQAFGPFTSSHPQIGPPTTRGGPSAGGWAPRRPNTNPYRDTMLTPIAGGEYVVNAVAAARPGVAALLDAINRGQGSQGKHLHYHEAEGRTGERSKDDVWRALVIADHLLGLTF